MYIEVLFEKCQQKWCVLQNEQAAIKRLNSLDTKVYYTKTHQSLAVHKTFYSRVWSMPIECSSVHVAVDPW